MTNIEQNDIIKPNSWEYIVAQEAKLSPEEFSSSQPTSIQQQIAHAFIESVRKKPTKYGIEEFSRCLEENNYRQERLQDKLQKEFEEVEQEESDRYAEYDRTLFGIAATENVLLSNINYFKSQMEYYTSLLSDAQKYAKATKDIFDKLPKDLPADALRSRFIEELHKEEVIYTPQKVVDAITRGIKYYGLMIDLYMAEAKEKNEKLLFGEYLEDYEIPNFNSTIYEEFMQSCPSDLIAFDLAELNFSKQEENLVSAWDSLGVDFPIPSVLTRQEPSKSDIKTLKAEPIANAKPTQTPSLTHEPVKEAVIVSSAPAQAAPQISSNLPPINDFSSLPEVCHFFYVSKKIDAFSVPPQTSAGIKALQDILLTPDMNKIYKSLKDDDACKYRRACKRLSEFYIEFEEKEVAQAEREGRAKAGSFGRCD